MNKFFFPFLIIFVCLLSDSLNAQTTTNKKKSVTLYGDIIDVRTKAGIEKVFVTLMTPDSMVLDTMHARTWNSSMNTRATTRYEFNVPSKPAQYIVKAQVEGYKTVCVEKGIQKIARNHWLEMPIIRLYSTKKAGMIEEDLDEVVVTATRVKMVHRGDTIIYNADAFNLEEGSMLQSLVKQLPGAELNSNGEIKVNGERVEELTLNGREFFNGNNNIMLQNLPSFTVKDIKVYRKSSERSEFLGYDIDERKLVMDVQLKRTYRTGILANMELGGGTNERWLGRLFGMRYTDCSRLSAFANANNVNETNKPGGEGDWEPSNGIQGQTKTRLAGVDLLIDEKEHRWREASNIIFHWDEIYKETKINSEQYYATNNVYNRMMNTNSNKNSSVAIHNNFRLYKPVFFVNMTDISYGTLKNNGISRSSFANASLEKWGSVQNSLDSIFNTMLDLNLQEILVNRNRDTFYSDNSSWHFSNTALLMHQFKTGDNITFNGIVEYDNLKYNNYTQQQIDYYKADVHNVANNRYNNNPSHKYMYEMAATYSILPTSTYTIDFGLEYKKTYEMQNKEYYRLDRISGWGVDQEHSIGTLPSNRNELILALDAANTYFGNSFGNYYKIELIQQWNNRKDLFARLSIPLIYSNEKLVYHSQTVNTTLNQKNFLVRPEGYFTYSITKYSLQLRGNFNVSISTPSLYKKIDVRNDENPLSIHLGNSSLKNSISETADLTIRKELAKEGRMSNSITFQWGARQRDISEGYSYNSSTGVYTFRPVNVDGNWNASITDDFEVWFGKSRKWSLTNNLGYSFIQNVDMAAVEGFNDAMLSTVKTKSLSEQACLSYGLKSLSIGFLGNFIYRHSSSDYFSGAIVEAFNFSYGLTCNYNIPGIKLSLASDIKMYSRRGYASSDFNSNDLVWNSSISKPFMKGKFVVRLEVFDIMHQLTNTNMMINEQGRTETVYNTLPRYAILHLQWNFNKIPKK